LAGAYTFILQHYPAIINEIVLGKGVKLDYLLRHYGKADRQTLLTRLRNSLEQVNQEDMACLISQALNP
jgi:hypothetical protein